MAFRVIFFMLALSFLAPARAEVWNETLARLTREAQQLVHDIQDLKARLRELGPQMRSEENHIYQRSFQQGAPVAPMWLNPGQGIQALQAQADQRQAELNALNQRYQEISRRLIEEIESLESRRKTVLVQIREEERAEQARQAARERAAAEEAERERELARQHEEEARAQEMERQQAEEEARQQALEREAALEARREQKRQEALRQAEAERAREEQRQREERERLAELQAARDLADAQVWVQRLSLAFFIAVLVLPCLPAYRLYAPARLFYFREWPFKGRLLLSALALGVFIRYQMGGLQTLTQVVWTLGFGVFAIPAVFFLPGLILLLGQYLHYLFFPHPSESHLHRIRQSGQPRPDDLGRVADTFHDPTRDGVFEEWRARNAERRTRAMTNLFREQNSLIDQLIENQRKKARFDD